jgi:Ca2+-binding RTX toxin-like protein
MYAPGQRYAGLAAFDDDVKSGLVPLEQGSFAFCVLLHEFGHGLGLAHPHDEGGTSKVLKGVTAEIGSYGIGGLNQGVYTTMTYNDGWPTGPLGASAGEGYGYQATPMALDIAVLQEKYGANLAHATGDDVYRLPQANREGTYYACIWDGGGADRIVFRGNADCAIDLREASLRGETGGAGWLSYADGIHGGLTIANGVVIERAHGGGGDDVIRGNGAGNLLRGHAGSDLLMGANGPDRLYGGAGPDELRGGRSDDLLVGGPGPDIFVVGAGSGNDRIMDFHPDADQIRIRSGATGFDPIAVSQDDDAAIVAFADVTLRLDDVPASALDAGDFLFG